jgi:hypothetical protein
MGKKRSINNRCIFLFDFKIPIDMQDTPVVFGILKKRQVKSMIEKIPELKSLGCKKYCIADLSDQFVVLGLTINN